MKKMKQVLALCLCLALLLALAGCGKSEYVKNAEALIDAIGEVTADSGEAIEAAQKAYDALTEDDKAKVENADLLPAAQTALQIALEEKAAAELEALRQSFVGAWKAELDEIELLCQSVDSSLGDPRISFRDYLDSFVLTVMLEFNADGSYHMYGEAAASEATVAALKEAVVRFYDDYILLALCDTLAESGYGSMSSWAEVESKLGMSKANIIFASLGMSLSEYVDTLFNEESVDQLFSAMNREGRYLVEPGKLHMSQSADEEPADGDYESFTLEGDELILTNFSGTSILEDLVYPMAFHRVG